MSQLCPCTSKLTYEKCCEPFLTGKALPESAEQLMRSRFTAYAMNKHLYLVETTAPERRATLTPDELDGSYCRSVKCISLKILGKRAGGPTDDTGVVIFHAKIQIKGKATLYREKGTFRREEGRWLFVSGETN